MFEGHMKGAKALDYTTLYDATTLQFKSPDAIKTLLATVGIDGTKTTYVHCRTGVIASLPFFILDALLDWPVEDYDGSWSQWGQLSANSANGGMLAADSPWRTDIPALSEAVAYNHAAKPVEELALDGSVCSSTLSTTNVITYSSSCTPSAPDSYATSGNQVEKLTRRIWGIKRLCVYRQSDRPGRRIQNSTSLGENFFLKAFLFFRCCGQIDYKSKMIDMIDAR